MLRAQSTYIRYYRLIRSYIVQNEGVLMCDVLFDMLGPCGIMGPLFQPLITYIRSWVICWQNASRRAIVFSNIDTINHREKQNLWLNYLYGTGFIALCVCVFPPHRQTWVAYSPCLSVVGAEYHQVLILLTLFAGSCLRILSLESMMQSWTIMKILVAVIIYQCTSIFVGAYLCLSYVQYTHILLLHIKQLHK